MELAAASAVIPHTVTLVLTQAPDGKAAEIPLLTKGAPPTQVMPEAYVGPIYIANGQPIVLKVDDAPPHRQAALCHGPHGQRPDRPGGRRGRQWGDPQYPVQPDAHPGIYQAVDVRRV